MVAAVLSEAVGRRTVVFVGRGPASAPWSEVLLAVVDMVYEAELRPLACSVARVLLAVSDPPLVSLHPLTAV